jgi:predicted Zn-dependent peptidase
LNIIKNGISDTKLKYFKISLLNRTKYIFSDENMKEMWYGNSLFYGMKINKDDYIELIKKITNDDIKTIAKQIFNFKQMGVVSCGKYNNESIIRNEIEHIKDTYAIL